MKAKELIKTLEKYPDADILVSVQTYTGKFPSLYLLTPKSELEERGHEWFIRADKDQVKINLHTSEGIIISKRNQK